MAKKINFNLESQSLFVVSESFEAAVSYWRYALVSAACYDQADKLQAKVNAKDAKSKYTENQILGMKDSITDFMKAGKSADDEAGKLVVAKEDFVKSACAEKDGKCNRPETVNLYLRIFAAGQETSLKGIAWEGLTDALSEGAYNALATACFAQTKTGKPSLSDEAFKAVKESLNKIMVQELSLPVAVEGVCRKTMFRATAEDSRAMYLTFVKSAKAETDKSGNLTGKLSFSTAITKKTDKKTGETVWSSSSFLRTMQEIMLAKLTC